MAVDNLYPDSSEYVDPAGTQSQSPADATGRQAQGTANTAAPTDLYPNYDFLNSTDFPDVDEAGKHSSTILAIIFIENLLIQFAQQF